MSADPSETEARNVMRALNRLRELSGSKFQVTTSQLQQRSGADAGTVRQVMERLEERDGIVVREQDSGEWEVRR